MWDGKAPRSYGAEYVRPGMIAAIDILKFKRIFLHIFLESVLVKYRYGIYNQTQHDISVDFSYSSFFSIEILYKFFVLRMKYLLG